MCIYITYVYFYLAELLLANLDLAPHGSARKVLAVYIGMVCVCGEGGKQTPHMHVHN